MKPTIRTKRAPALDEDELRQLNGLSFESVIADLGRSEQRPPEDIERSRAGLDLESTHTDRTINELLTGAYSESEPVSLAEPRVLAGEDPGAGDATEDLIAPDILFPELTLKS